MSTHIERPDLDNIFQSWKLLSGGSQSKASTTVGGTISSCRKSSASVSQQKPWGNECCLRLFNFPPGPWFLKQGWCGWKSETPEKWGRGRSLAESAGDRTSTAAAAEGLSVAKAPGCGGNKYFLLGFFLGFPATQLNLHLLIGTAQICYETILLCFTLV